MQAPRWLITGANGFLGYRVGELAVRSGDTFGMVRTAGRRVADGVAPVLGDLDDLPSLERLVLMVRPTHVVHLAAMTHVADCEVAPADSLRRNVDASRQLARCCHRAKARFVFTSTDMVFDGRNGPFSESSSPQPVNCYGEHKLLAEEAVVAECPNAVICRLPWMFGPSTPQYDGHFAGMVKQLLAGKEVTLFDDEIRTPLGTEQVAKALLDIAINPPDVRLLHFAGPQPMDRFTIGRLAAQAVSIPESQLIAGKQADWNGPAARPAEVCLITQYSDILTDLCSRDTDADIRACAKRVKADLDAPNPHDHSHSILSASHDGHSHDGHSH
jgi:dTDP-4-dehydrorhamnose reductase